MKRTRRVFGGEFRAKVALAAVKGDQTLSELAKRFQVYPTQIHEWKRRLIEQAAAALREGVGQAGGECRSGRAVRADWAAQGGP